MSAHRWASNHRRRTLLDVRPAIHEPNIKHVCHRMFGMVDLALFWTETSWWKTMVFALCGRQHGPHAYKSSTQTEICTEETRASSVEWTQHKLRSSPRQHTAHTTCGNKDYVITWYVEKKKKNDAELIHGTAPNGNTNTTNRLDWIGAPNI